MEVRLKKVPILPALILLTLLTKRALMLLDHLCSYHSQLDNWEDWLESSSTCSRRSV